jgi:FAD/FMN-containing dehydrogenase
MRAAAADGVRLVPQGARTGLVGAGLADGDVILSLERMNRAPEIDPVNRTAEVDAGVLLSTLNAAAGEHGLFFPIDLGADPSIGGMIATNTGGARLLRYGDVRRNLLSLEVVLADGEGSVVQLGRALWKDNSGLDLKQLWTGGSGALGVVTRATLALQPKPVAQVTAMLALDRPEVAVDVLGSLEADLGALLTAFEGMSRAALAAAFAHVPRLRMPFTGGVPAYAVLVELSAGAAFSEDILEEALATSLAPWIEGADPSIRDIAVDRRDGLWAIRHAIPEGLRAMGKVIGCDIALRRGEVMRFRTDVAARLAAAAPGFHLHDFGHIGDGGLHFNLVWPREAGRFDPEAGERARAIVFEAAVRDYGGSFSAEHGLGPVNAAYYQQLVPAAERRLAGRIQQLVAPQRVGRVDFGMEECA